jgi:hypothetical protein
LKIELKGCPFITIEMVETELQAVLNTLPGSILNMVEVLGTVHTRVRELLQG